jgi:hypothetical protein
MEASEAIGVPRPVALVAIELLVPFGVPAHELLVHAPDDTAAGRRAPQQPADIRDVFRGRRCEVSALDRPAPTSCYRSARLGEEMGALAGRAVFQWAAIASAHVLSWFLRIGKHSEPTRPCPSAKTGTSRTDLWGGATPRTDRG